MFEKNMSCEMRVMYAVFFLLFLLTIAFGKFFAILGLLITAFVAISGICIGAKILGPIICQKSVIDDLENLTGKVKSVADKAVDKAKGATDTIKDKVSKKD